MNKLLLIVLLFINAKIFAQNPDLEFKVKYEQAKADLKNKKYEAARSKFLSLKNGSIYPAYSPYIGYFLSNCYFLTNNIQQAENELITIQKNYPNWPKINDVNYLLAKTFLNGGKLEAALYSFNTIKTNNFQNEIKNEVSAYFLKNNQLNYPANWLEKYPNLSYLKAIINQPNVAKIYDLKAENLPYLPIKPKGNFSDNNYNIGLLFPFKLDSTQTEANQYIFDLYEGILLAAEKLKNEKINIKLHAYNVSSSANDMLKLLQNKLFLEEAILVGPLYPEPNKIAQYYANERKTLLVNPLSKNTQLINNKPFSYLNKASTIGFARQASKFLAYNFVGETAIIYEKSDTTLLKICTAELKKSNTKYTAIAFHNIEALTSIAKKQFGSILMLTNPKNNQNIITNINKKWSLTPIIIHKDNLPAENYSKLGDAELYIFNQDFIDEEAENIKQFRADYWEKRNNLASIYTLKGYDMMLFWGRQIHKYKQNLPNMLNITNASDDFLINNFNYSLTPNENSAFTITTIQNGIEIFYRKF